MKKLMFKQIYFIFLALFIFASCEKTETIQPGGNGTILNPGPHFNIDKFEQNLIDAMDGNAVGWSYSISKAGQKYADGAGGDAVVAVRGQGQIDQSPNRRMTIASISKPMTAIAFYKVCKQVNMVVETPIKFYLPQSWDIHPTVNNITFGDLLRHRSGFKSGGNDYEGLREMVETGINPADYGNYDYLNANYGLFRIIIPHILEYQLMFAIKDDHSQLASATAEIFRNYMQDEVFTPAGVNNVSWAPSGNNPTLLYDFDDTSNPWLASDYSETCGAYGLYLSSNEVMSVIAHARYDDSYLDPQYRELLMEEFMGFKEKSGDHGTYSGHGGDWISGGRGFTGLVMTFPIQVEATLLINSRNGNHPEKYTIMREAFDNAWE